MWCRNLIRQEAVGLVLELIHDDSKHATARLTCTATGRFHYAKITTGTDRKPCFSNQSTGTSCLTVFRILLNTFGTAKDRNYSFGGLAHFLTSAVNINDPFCL